MLKSKNNFLENNYYFFRIPITKNYFLLSNIKKIKVYTLCINSKGMPQNNMPVFRDHFFWKQKKQATYFE